MRIRLLLALVVVFVLSFSANGQAVGDFQSFQTGNWNDVNSWSRWDGASWINPAPNTPTSADGAISVLASHQVTIPSGFSVTVDQTSIAASSTSKIIVSSGGVLTLKGSGSDLSFKVGLSHGTLEVSGDLIVNQSATIVNVNSSKLLMMSGGHYKHNYTTSAGQIYGATWATGSTLEFTGYTSNGSAPSGLSGVSFYNVVWNCSSQAADIDLNGSLGTVNGDFSVTNTGSSGNFLILSDATSFTMNVTGNFNVSSSASITPNAFTSATTTTLNITGNFSYTSSSTSYLAFSGSSILNVTGTFTLNSSGGGLDFSGDVGSTTLNASGNFSVTSGTLARSGSGTANINFSGSSVVQTFSSTPITDQINFTVNNSAILSLGTSSITGSGTFTLNASSFLQVGSTDTNGAIQNSSSAGNIRNSGSRTYNSTSTITYNGTGVQKIGNGFPSNVNLEIANSNGVINNNIGVTNVVGTLTLTSGAFTIGSSNTLNIQSNFVVTGGTIGGSSTSNLTFSGSGSIGTLTFATGTELLNNLTISRTGTVVLGSNLTVGGTIALTSGNLDFSGVTLTMNGGSITGGGLKSNSSSNLIFGGSTFSGSVPYTGSGNQLNNLTFSTPGGAFTWSSAVTINSNLNMTAGALTHNSGITMAANSTVNMGGGTISSNPLGAASSYNVNYTGSGNTGVELPTSSTALNDLTVASSGTVALAINNITINGNVTLSGGTFSSGTNNFTMKGSSWTVNSGGSFSGGAGVVSFGGSTTVGGTGTINFSNLATLSGSTLTLPSGNTNISGDLSLNSGSTFNHNGGTIILNGSTTQTITGGGKSFKNVTVNKTGGIVDLLPTLNLTGLLTISSSTTVQSNGNLTLISTSDGTSGTASIAAIPAGASVTGNVVAQRYISAKGRVFHDISSPVQGATVQQIMSSGISVTGFPGSSFFPSGCGGCATNNASMYLYDETVTGAITNGYKGMTSAAQTLTTGLGYDMLDRNEVGTATMSLTGAINSGAISLPVSFTNSGLPSADGWNLVGNPYPSSINWDASGGAWTKTNIAGNMISVWDAGANQYKTWNGSTGSLGSGVIGQGQGFWFQCSAAPTLNITENAKTSTTGSFLREASQPIHTVELILTGAGVEDRTYVQQIEGSTLGFDAMDGPKLTINNFSLATLTNDNRSLAINAIGQIISSGRIPLTISNIDNGEYTFTQASIGDFQNVKISIYDQSTHAYADLSNGAKYTFTFEDRANTRQTDRFELIFGEVNVEREPVSLYPNPVSQTLNLTINSADEPQGEVIDLLGKPMGLITWKKTNDSASGWAGSFDMQPQSTGVYMVKIKAGNENYVKRFVKQ